MVGCKHDLPWHDCMAEAGLLSPHDCDKTRVSGPLTRSEPPPSRTPRGPSAPTRPGLPLPHSPPGSLSLTRLVGPLCYPKFQLLVNRNCRRDPPPPASPGDKGVGARAAPSTHPVGPLCYPAANQELSGGSGGFPPGPGRRIGGYSLLDVARPPYSGGGPSLLVFFHHHSSFCFFLLC